MIVPGPLFSSRFIPLEERDAIACIDLFHRQRNRFGGSLDLCRDLYRQVIDVLKVFIGYGENVSSIVWPLSDSDEGSDQVILVNEISLLYRVMLILNALHKQTEWTDIVFRCVIVQDKSPDIWGCVSAR